MSQLEQRKAMIMQDVSMLKRRQQIAYLAGIHLNTLTNIIHDKQTPTFDTMVAIENAGITIKRKHNIRNKQ